MLSSFRSRKGKTTVSSAFPGIQTSLQINHFAVADNAISPWLLIAPEEIEAGTEIETGNQVSP